MSSFRTGLWLIVCLPLLSQLSARGETPPAKPALDQYGEPLPKHARGRLGTLRFRHGSAITSVRYLDGGKTLLSVGADQVIRFWDAENGRQLRDFSVTVGMQTTAQLSPDARSVAVMDNDRTLKVWDVPSGKLRHTLEIAKNNPLGNLGGLMFSRDSKYLAVSDVTDAGGNDAWPVIRLYDLVSGKELRSFSRPVPKDGKEPMFVPQNLLFSLDGKKLVAAGTENNKNGIIRFWDVATGKELKGLDKHEGRTGQILFSPDDKMLIDLSTDPKTNQYTSLCIWDLTSGKELRKLGGGQVPINPNSVTWSPDGKMAAAAHVGNNGVLVWEVATGKQLAEVGMGANGAGIAAVMFSPNSKVLAVGQMDGKIDLHDSATGKELHVLKGFGGGGGPQMRNGSINDTLDDTTLNFSPDGKTIAAASGTMIRRWDVASGKELPGIDGVPESEIAALAVAPDGKRAVSAGINGQVHVWDLAKSTVIHQLAGPALEAGGIPAQFLSTSVGFSPDGKRIAAAWLNGAIQTWDAGTGKEQRNWEAHPFGTPLIQFTPNGRMLVSGGMDGRVVWWEPGTGKLLRQFKDFAQEDMDGGVQVGQNFAVVVAVAPDGKTVAAAGFSSTDGYQVRLWETATGKLRRKVPVKFDNNNMGGPPGAAGIGIPGGNQLNVITCMTFTPDSRALAWVQGSTIRHYDLRRGKEVRQFGGQDGSITGMAFSPDGKLLAASSDDGTVRIWEAANATLVREFTGHRGSITALAFTPDGQTLLTGGSDTTVLLWDLAALLKEERNPAALSAQELTDAWKQLAGDDSTGAYDTILKLAGTPQIVPWLGERVKPMPPVDGARIARLVADLENDRFEVRRQATADLEKLGTVAEAALRKRLDDKIPLEVSQRIEKLLEKLAGPVTDPEDLRALRAVETLELIGTAEAQALLKSLTKGAPEARLTREAREALERLAGK